ncbi:hypothetical protein M9H77_30973 [Catharanthus roseus]|uniref:Uncharacterized protein n=1 Tax=Catharanthus roseus TaxID=4058 RepID=A0ACB9ZZ60_CATRO|nr:hypothetical protein M9H77_30973 [Catharanthus roseus]
MLSCTEAMVPPSPFVEKLNLHRNTSIFLMKKVNADLYLLFFGTNITLDSSEVWYTIPHEFIQERTHNTNQVFLGNFSNNRVRSAAQLKTIKQVSGSSKLEGTIAKGTGGAASSFLLGEVSSHKLGEPSPSPNPSVSSLSTIKGHKAEPSVEGAMPPHGPTPEDPTLKPLIQQAPPTVEATPLQEKGRSAIGEVTLAKAKGVASKFRNCLYHGGQELLSTCLECLKSQ